MAFRVVCVVVFLFGWIFFLFISSLFPLNSLRGMVNIFFYCPKKSKKISSKILEIRKAADNGNLVLSIQYTQISSSRLTMNLNVSCFSSSQSCRCMYVLTS